MKEDVTFIIFGATGDLTKKKLIPAIYNLIKHEKISKFALIGAANTDSSIREILNNSRNYIKNINKIIWNKLIDNSYYHKLDFYKKSNYIDLKNFIEKVEKEKNLSGNRIFYLAILPKHFGVTTSNIKKCCIFHLKR